MTTRVGCEGLANPAMPAAAGEQDTGERDRVTADAGEQDGISGRQPRSPVLRWSGLVWLGAFLLLLANDPGRMFFETKLSVDLNPYGFYASLWHIMDPLNTFGMLNNQAIGYAVPMAPFYLAGHLAHVPVWLTERLWLSLIIAVGFGGLVKLAGALGIGSPASRLLAGLVFALWPTFTIVIGSTSSAVLPLIAAVRGRGGVVWPAARSGAVVLCMSGVNATVTIDALLLPGLFILTYARGRRLVALAACWGAAVAMATAWWAMPLLLQGRYAFNFLPYVEQAVTTTGSMSAAATLRGAGNWTAYLNLGTPWLPAGWAMVSTPMAIIVGAIAAACGLYGLALRSMPGAVWLRLSAGLAAVIALAGYSGTLGGPFHGPVDHLLDGALAPFRNVYKVEPVIAAALALGLAHAVATWLAKTPARQANPLHRVFTLEARAVVGVGPARPGALRRRGIADPAGHGGKGGRIGRAGQRPGRLSAAGRRPLPRGAERPGPGAGGLHARGAGAPDPGAVRVRPGRRVRAGHRRQADPAAGDPAAAGGAAEPREHPAGQPDRAGQRGPGLAAAAHGSAAPQSRPARHHRRGSVAGPARAVGGHRRAAPRRHAVRPGQRQ